MQQILDVANYIVTHVPWDVLIASGILSPLLLAIKKWFSVQSEKVMISLVAFVALMTATGHYLLTVPTGNPSVIAVQAAVLAFMTQPIYFFVVKPIWLWFSAQLSAAAAYRSEVLSATVPETGVPAEIPPKLADIEVQEFGQ